MSEQKLSLVCEAPQKLEQANAVAEALSIPLQDEPNANSAYVLLFADDGVSLNSLSKKERVQVDFVGGSAAHRRKFGGGKGQMIAKAVGLKQGRGISVLDATAGLGGDAFVLASLGCSVQMLERSPVAYALLADGLARGLNYAREHDTDLLAVLERMQLTDQDGITFMQAAECRGVDVVYLDPMFPLRKKSAAVKKEMVAFHSLVGTDDDSAALLEGALEYANHRVVVKRPRIAPVVVGQAPNYSLEGKSSRFDIYTLKAFTG